MSEFKKEHVRIYNLDGIVWALPPRGSSRSGGAPIPELGKETLDWHNKPTNIKKNIHPNTTDKYINELVEDRLPFECIAFQGVRNTEEAFAAYKNKVASLLCQHRNDLEQERQEEVRKQAWLEEMSKIRGFETFEMRVMQASCNPDVSTKAIGFSEDIWVLIMLFLPMRHRLSFIIATCTALRVALDQQRAITRHVFGKLHLDHTFQPCKEAWPRFKDLFTQNVRELTLHTFDPLYHIKDPPHVFYQDAKLWKLTKFHHEVLSKLAGACRDPKQKLVVYINGVISLKECIQILKPLNRFLLEQPEGCLSEVRLGFLEDSSPDEVTKCIAPFQTHFANLVEKCPKVVLFINNWKVYRYRLAPHLVDSTHNRWNWNWPNEVTKMPTYPRNPHFDGRFDECPLPQPPYWPPSLDEQAFITVSKGYGEEPPVPDWSEVRARAL